MSKKTGRRRPKDGRPSKTCEQKQLARAKDAARKRRKYWADPAAARAKGRAKRLRNLERCRAQSRARYWVNVDHNRALARERARSERGRASNRKAVERYRQRHPEIVAAHKATQRALRRGELKRPTVCEVLGCNHTERLHAHHHRADRPLAVVYICQNPHHEHVHHIGPLKLKDGAARRWARAPRQPSA